jgi:hypothetical protein
MDTRHFDIYTYTHRSITEEALEAKVNDMFNADPGAMKEGYAPFCKHLFVPNFIEGATVEAVPVCMYVCMCVYIYTCIYMYVFMYVCA